MEMSSLLPKETWKNPARCHLHRRGANRWLAEKRKLGSDEFIEWMDPNRAHFKAPLRPPVDGATCRPIESRADTCPAAVDRPAIPADMTGRAVTHEASAGQTRSKGVDF